MRLASFLARYLRRYWRWAVLAAFSTVLYAATPLLLLQLTRIIFSEVLRSTDSTLPREVSALVSPSDSQPDGASPSASPAVPARLFLHRFLHDGYDYVANSLGVTPQNVIYFVPALFVLVFLLRSASDFANGYAFQRIGFGATTDLRNDLYQSALGQSSRFHAEHPSGELVSRVVHDVGVLQAAISTRLVDLFQQSFALIGLLALLFSIDFWMALVCLLAAPAVLYPIVRFAKGMRRTSHRAQERTADLANLVSEVSRGHRVVKAFGMERFEQARFREATRKHLVVNLKGQLLANLSGPVVESLGAVGAGFFLVFAGRTIQSGTMDAATLIEFLLNLYMLYDPIRKLNKANLVIQQSLAAAQRIRQVLLLPVEIVDRLGARPAERFAESIRFESVSFRYDHREVLTELELEVRRGEVVAFVGPSGGGKTTLVNLLPRFFDVTEGRITIDGVDIRDLTLESLRALVGLVTQETMLFNDTVRNNIAYGRTDLPLEQVRAAAKAAHADDFILEMASGYDTVVGEAGVRLSGGQRQRVAIARALLKNAPILILDEATSQLDSESEALVQDALVNLMRDRTTLVVAHRLSTVARADRIHVLEGGRVVAAGRHEELLAAAGTYRRLYELQFVE